MQINSCNCCDVSSYDLIRMSFVWHVFLSRVLPRTPDYVIASKREIYHLDTYCSQKINSLDSEITLVCALSLLSVNFPHM